MIIISMNIEHNYPVILYEKRVYKHQVCSTRKTLVQGVAELKRVAKALRKKSDVKSL